MSMYFDDVEISKFTYLQRISIICLFQQFIKIIITTYMHCSSFSFVPSHYIFISIKKYMQDNL